MHRTFRKIFVVSLLALSLTVTATACFWTGKKGDGTDAAETEENEPGIEEIFADNNWHESQADSYLVPGSGKTFKYYKEKAVADDYYYEGHYKIFAGKDAEKYLTEDLAAYGVTKEELKGLYSRNDKYDRSNLVCLVLENETCMIGGENTLSETVVTPYYGFYLTDKDKEVLDLANMNSASYYLFVREDR